MARQKADDVKKEVEEQKEEFYGEDQGAEAVDVDEKMKDAFGEDVQEKIDNKSEPFTMSKEVEDDEKKRRGK